MERAGTAVADVVADRFPGRVAVVCGAGNNGGDGRVCARVLRERGRDVELIEGFGDLGEPDVIVDALLGIGLRDAPREDVARMIERINGSGRPVVAVDVPSGVIASTGEVPGAAVRATVTVTFGGAKLGLAVAPGRFHSGLVHVAWIGLDAGSLRARARDARSAGRGAAEGRREHQVPGRIRARRRRLAGLDRGADAGRARGLPRRRGLRHRRGPGVRAARPRGASARGGQARPARGRLREVAAAGRRGGAGSGGAGTCSRARARARPQRRHPRPRPHRCSNGCPFPVVLDADGLWALEPFERASADRDDAALGRAGPAARDGGGGDRRPPARVGPAGGVALRLDSAAEGSRHAGRLAPRGGARRDVRRAVACHRRDGRRALRRDRGVPRQGHGAAARRGGRPRWPTGSPPSSPLPRRGSSRATCCPASSARWKARARTCRRSP